MAFDTSNKNDLAKLTLVASDQAYAGNGVGIGAALAPFSDSPGAPANYRDTPYYSVADSGFVVAHSWEDTPSGFKYVLYKNPITREVIVAFAGTDGTDARDWWANGMHYGWNQWTANDRRNAKAVFRAIQELNDALPGGISNIHFTGQSLGGALAQYALYDFVKDKPLGQGFSDSKISITTFNGLGGLAALQDAGGLIYGGSHRQTRRGIEVIGWRDVAAATELALSGP